MNGVPPDGVTKLPQPEIVLAPGVSADTSCGREFGWPDWFTVPVVMLYGVPAERIMIGLTVIVCGKFKLPNRKTR